MPTLRTESFLDQLIDPVIECLTPESAGRIVNVRADPATQARVDELARKANEGELTADEREEYQLYVWANDFIALLQVKAQAVLDRD